MRSSAADKTLVAAALLRKFGGMRCENTDSAWRFRIAVLALGTLLLATQCRAGSPTRESRSAATSGSRPAEAYLFLEQDGRRTPIQDQDRLNLRRAPFAFVFPMGHYGPAARDRHSVRIAGSTNNEFLELTLPQKLEEPRGNLVLFAPGTGMSSDEDGRYSIFYLEDNHAHHYVVYDPNEPRAQRAERIRDLGSGRSEFRFPVGQFKYDERVFTVADLPRRELFFVILMDQNLDRVMESGEVFRFTLAFP